MDFWGFRGRYLITPLPNLHLKKKLKNKINLIEELLIAKLLIDNYRWIFGVFGAII